MPATHRPSPTPSRRSALLALACIAAATPAAHANQAPGGQPRGDVPPAEVRAGLPGARLIGTGRLTWFGLHVYDARLWAVDELKPADFADTPLALEIEYARDLRGAQIAERSIDEMKRSGEVASDTAARCLATMRQIFPDVTSGDRITGVLAAGGVARFFVNGQPRGEVRDAEFTRRFFGIWLAPSTSEPRLRASLLGGRRSAS